MRHIWIVAAALLAPGVWANENAESIIRKFEDQKITALLAYAKANPKAEDLDAALETTVTGLMQWNREAEALPLLLQWYERLTPSSEGTFQGVVGLTGQIYARLGRREEGLAFLARVKKDYAKDENAEAIGQMLEPLKSLFQGPQVGDVLQIKFTALDGRTVDLAALQGKVVLVDFWATWCGPCRQELPHVLSAYEKWHENGFEVIGISLDEDKEALLNFLEAKKMPWPQQFDGKGWKNDLARQYSINGIPATFLVGKDGKVASCNLRGEKLAEKVAELLTTK